MHFGGRNWGPEVPRSRHNLCVVDDDVDVTIFQKTDIVHIKAQNCQFLLTFEHIACSSATRVLRFGDFRASRSQELHFARWE